MPRGAFALRRFAVRRFAMLGGAFVLLRRALPCTA
jgi:hypothetical protein